MSNQLKFNTDDLRTQASRLENIEEDLRQCSKDLTSKLADLRKDWQSEAGRAFFNKYDDSWITEIDSQCDKIQQLAGAVKTAANTYQPVEDEFNRINF